MKKESWPRNILRLGLFPSKLFQNFFQAGEYCNERKKGDQYFYGHGKILLTGEYFIIDGAKSLALPTSLGQSLSISYSPSFDPLLTWKSYDHDGKLWVDTKFEFWRFDILKPNPTPEDIYLQKLLREARKLNSHFLRDEEDVLVEARLEFPVKWGLGSSSTLIYNIAQWAM